MPILATIQIRKAKGFTLIEILVTLVILGLTAALVGPGIESWLDARQTAAARDAVANEIAGLPLLASIQQQHLVIERVDQLAVQDIPMIISKPIEVLANGFCKGGEYLLRRGETSQRFAEPARTYRSVPCARRRHGPARRGCPCRRPALAPHDAAVRRAKPASCPAPSQPRSRPSGSRRRARRL